MDAKKKYKMSNNYLKKITLTQNNHNFDLPWSKRNMRCDCTSNYKLLCRQNESEIFSIDLWSSGRVKSRICRRCY